METLDFSAWLGAHLPGERLIAILEQILDSLEEGVVIHDPARKILFFNRALERITGFARDLVIGRDCREVFPPDGICGSRCGSQHPPACCQPDAEPYEVTFTDRQGIERRIRVLQRPLSEPPSVLALIRDVTEVSELRFQVRDKYSFQGMVGRSASMREVFTTIRQVTGSDYPVLITGESGTGKELVARAIHNESRRQAGPFVPINCGALPVTILESELFGHVRGAFTGAIRDKKGRFELADRGTLFLDEVGDLDPAFQVKLLRVLQEQRFEMVGGERPIQVDVRVISATNRDLRGLIETSGFRQDLYYRLAVVPIHLPPLRERREDLALLVEQILASVRHETGKPIERLSDAVMDLLQTYSWPGNIRELINALQYAAVRTPDAVILPDHLPPEVRASWPSRKQSRPRRSKLDPGLVQSALQKSHGNKREAARLLKVGRATLYRFLARHQ